MQVLRALNLVGLVLFLVMRNKYLLIIFILKTSITSFINDFATKEPLSKGQFNWDKKKQYQFLFALKRLDVIKVDR